MTSPSIRKHKVVVIGGGAAGLAAAASLLKRRPGLDLAVVEPKQVHDYQPGWTLVGAGVFDRAATQRPMAKCIPVGAAWIQDAMAAVDPQQRRITLGSGGVVEYEALVVAPGLRLAWEEIAGLEEALGQYGVTSNYRADLAPYTWSLVRSLTKGQALFTQPTMPIKCAGAPQKAVYLSADYWRRRGGGPKIAFHAATPALFGVAHYVPALMRYIERYGVDLQLQSQLIAVDGPGRRATFRTQGPQGESIVHRSFDMLHVCPPQRPLPAFAGSVLAGQDGWIEVDPQTLQHPRFAAVFALGDGVATTNAKTAAAARKQAPVVAENLLAYLDGKAPAFAYDGYGSCPLTVERGRIVLAEFGYGGRLLPTLPRRVLDGDRATRRAWWLKTRLLPFIYWHGMLRGREWLVAPKPSAG
ncbi:FAD/NAD(P)-binding oxidoreductase [Caulobacter segnis]|uniref:NAD(P)/FAD-dependent oxidoreductase n=1 Tax=Caulobacter segnis TaxID=88688 RepID=UPI00240F8539|nr:FAD/NAD(P)-binding oxidoreductase [Caulobacter segnis]MDG2522928.1 FAD/NAD(P)-binding oxidoreductase [Caulobacter segnis]